MGHGTGASNASITPFFLPFPQLVLFIFKLGKWAGALWDRDGLVRCSILYSLLAAAANDPIGDDGGGGQTNH